jgi:hypothetical protein
MKGIQSFKPTKGGESKDERLVSIGAHGAATEPLGPYFVQITTSWDKCTPDHKWTTLSLTVEDAINLHTELSKAIYARKGLTNGEASFHEITTALKAK